MSKNRATAVQGNPPGTHCPHQCVTCNGNDGSDIEIEDAVIAQVATMEKEDTERQELHDEFADESGEEEGDEEGDGVG